MAMAGGWRPREINEETSKEQTLTPGSHQASTEESEGNQDKDCSKPLRLGISSFPVSSISLY